MLVALSGAAANSDPAITSSNTELFETEFDSYMTDDDGLPVHFAWMDKKGTATRRRVPEEPSASATPKEALGTYLDGELVAYNIDGARKMVSPRMRAAPNSHAGERDPHTHTCSCMRQPHT